MRRKFHYFDEYQPYNFVTKFIRNNKNSKQKSSYNSLLGRRSKSLHGQEAFLRNVGTSFCLRLNHTAKKSGVRCKTMGYEEKQIQALDSADKSAEKLKIKMKRQAKQEAPMFKPNLVRKIIDRAASRHNVPQPQLEIKSMFDSKASHKNSRIFNKSSEKGQIAEPVELVKSNQQILQELRTNLAKRIFEINRESLHNYQGIKSKLQAINNSLTIKKMTSTQDNTKSISKIPPQHSSINDNLSQVRQLIREYMSHL